MRADKIHHLLDKITKPHGAITSNYTTDVQHSDATNTPYKAAQPSPPAGRLPSLVYNLEEDHLSSLCERVQDYQIVHGGILKTTFPLPGEPEAYTTGQTLGVSLYPSPFPRALFEEACLIQSIFQQLYVAITKNSEWVRAVLSDIIEGDDLARTIWSVYEAVQTAKKTGANHGSKISAAIFRSDYMLNADAGSVLQLKQVEMNTISCAGAVHGQRTAEMHRFLRDTGSYLNASNHSEGNNLNQAAFEIPYCGTVQGICKTLITAHETYTVTYAPESPASQHRLCILMVVQPWNYNIADERPIEYGLWTSTPQIPCYRIEWGREMIETTSLTTSGALLFKVPFTAEICEVSVVYYRAGFEDREYTDLDGQVGFEARLKFELSNAVKCPDLLTHLAGSKKVQQALCAPSAIEQFINHDDACRLEKTFMQMFPLDYSDAGEQGRRIVESPDLVRQYVLKPSKEGGGHNHYRSDIKTFLDTVPSDSWSQYVLMELIDPVVSKNTLASSNGIWSGDTVAELGIWGGCVWIHSDKPEIVMNSQIGWSVRSKNPEIDEMSVVKGFGCFDSIALADC